MRRLTCAILLAILVLQPVVLTTNFVMVSNTPDGGPTGLAIVAQEPGSRLDSDEYTNHVPVIINGTADFDSQGWPGSGSAASPYIISGLRIAYDVGIPCISIMNTNAYFVIRDCLIDQGSNEDGIVFANTVHARIEYTTALSYGAALSLDNANNTEVSHSYAYGFLGMALEIYDSIYCNIDSSHLNSSDHRGFYSYMAHYLTMTSNEILTLAPVWFTSYIEYSNHTTFSLNSYDGGLASFSALMSYDITASDLTMTDGGSGLNLITCGDSTFTRINVVDSGTQGVILINSESVSIVDSSISVPSGTGVYIVDSNSASLEGTTIDDTANQGVLVENSLFTSIQQNTISNTGSFGVDVQNSNDTLVEGNSFSSMNAVSINVAASMNATINGNHLFDLTDLAIELISSDDAVVTGNTVEDTLDHAFWATSSHTGILSDNTFIGVFTHATVILEGSQNWTIADNFLDTSYKAVLLLPGSDGAKIYRNDIRNMESSLSMMIQIISSLNCEIVNNTGFNGENIGIRIDGSPLCFVEGNTIDRVPTGLSTNSANTTINDNVFSRITEYGILIDQGDYATVTNNIVDSGEYGVYISYSIDSTFTGNTLTNCGFGFSEDQTLVYLNHVFSNNEVNGKPLYYNRGTDGLTLNGDDYGEIILVDCETATITGGEFYNSTSAVQLYRCNEIDISGVVSKYNHISFQVEYSTNVTISDSSVIGGGEFGDFRARYSDGFVLDTCTANYTIAPYSAYITYSDGYLIEDCRFEHLSGDAFYQLNSDSGTITGSVFYNVTNGVWISSAQNCVVQYSYFAWAGYAIRSSGPAHYMNVTNNDIHDNLFGIYLSGGDNCIVRNNTVRWNSVVGIYLDYSDSTEVFYNILALNLGGNSYDDNAAAPNSWDDGVDTGNWWSDFTGSPPYNIPGPSGSTDQYPMNYMVTEPIINEAHDAFYAEFSEGNEITWYPIDDNLRDWTVEIGGSFWASDAWNFVDITVNIDGLSYGTHTAHITVRDLDGNTVEDWVTINVFDDTPPTISIESNMVIFEGATGNEIVWDVSDQNPDHYSLEIFDGSSTTTQTGPWSDGQLAFNLDSLTEGTYTYRLTAYDVDSNSVTNGITIFVLVDSDDPLINSPDDIEFIEGSYGHFLIWSASDDNPSHFVIEENSTTFATDDWGGTSITLELDNLSPGYYTFEITVYDLGGNSATDAVNVTIVPLAGWPLIPPDFTLLIIIAVIGVGAVAAAVVIIYVLRKRKSGGWGGYKE